MTPWRPHLLPERCTPPVVVAAWRRRGPVVALETGVPSAAHGAQTLVAGLPLARFTVQRGACSLEPLRPGGGAAVVGSRRGVQLGGSTPFHALQQAVAELAFAPLPADAPPLGAFGCFGYECRADPSLPRLAPFLDGDFLLTDVVVRWREPGAPGELWTRDAAQAAHWIEELAATAPPEEPGPPPASAADPFQSADFPFADYDARFARARAALEAGDSYQLCFTYPLRRRLAGDPFDLWLRLRRDHKAPFSAYFESGAATLVSCSPERFLRVDRDGRIEARPMKGTALRPQDAEACAAASRALQGSAKALAENLMIADLLRHDLGRVAALGSVRAAQPALIEEHATLLQMVSVIEGRLAAGRTVADLLDSAFPPGSMTGAPKVRAIELLRELEEGPRGPYSGILGYLAADGRCDWSVVIRTAACAQGEARVQVGGGLVWDSRSQEEWEESRAKAAPLLRALAAEAAASGGASSAACGGAHRKGGAP
ncbi:MAG: chorismate-binding protein [Planctomycetes bacterium]|nr:chorismate-binding protein [Planctomycetota bacterium]